MRGEYKTRQKDEMRRFLAAHAMQCFAAEELVRAMEAEGVRVGRTTAYRYLEALCQRGVARRYQDTQGLIRYQYLGEDAGCDEHFHMVCARCGTMFHVDCAMVGQLSEHLQSEHGFSIDARQSVLVGLCRACAGGEKHGTD